MRDDSLTFRDLIVRVAELDGKAKQPTAPDQVADLPEDAYELDRIKRAINDGLREIVRAYPRWRSLRPTLSITLPYTPGANNINNDSSMLRLPYNYQIIPLGEWTAVAADGSNNVGMLRFVHESMIIADLARYPTRTGVPRYCSLEPVAPNGKERRNERRMMIRVTPRPDRDYVLQGQVQSQVVELVEMEDRCPLGAIHDLTIIDAAMYVLTRNGADPQKKADYTTRFANAIEASMGADREIAPERLGTLEDGTVIGDNEDLYKTALPATFCGAEVTF